MEKRYCPYCGREVFQSEETEYGIFCECNHNFWFSETLPENWKEQGYILLNDYLKMKGIIK